MVVRSTVSSTTNRVVKPATGPGGGTAQVEPGVDNYLRPATTDKYRRPDGTSLYKRPA